MAKLPSFDELREAKKAIGSWCVSLTENLMCVWVTVSSSAFAFQLLAVFGGRPAVRLRRTCSCCCSGTSSPELRLWFQLVGRNENLIAAEKMFRKVLEFQFQRFRCDCFIRTLVKAAREGLISPLFTARVSKLNCRHLNGSVVTCLSVILAPS